MLEAYYCVMFYFEGLGWVKVRISV